MENKKTILEWLQELPEPIRTQALDNTELHPVGHSNFVVDSLAIAISLAFTWHHTPEKISYWSDIHAKAERGELMTPTSNTRTLKQAFEEAGFKAIDDPQFMYEYDLSDKNEEYENDLKPALLFDGANGSFCITDGSMMFIYFNASEPSDAVEWANRITGFELN